MDLIFLKKLQRYVKFIGVCPWYYDTAKTSFNYTYLVAVIDLLMMMTNLYIWIKIVVDSDSPSIYYMVPFCEIFTLMGFLVASYYAAIRFGSYWNRLLENFREVDCMLNRKGLQVNTIKTHFLGIFLFNTCCMIVLAVTFFEKRNNVDIFSLLYTLQYMCHTYKKLVMTIITNSLTLIIGNRYKLLAILLKTEFHSNRENVKGTLKEIERLMETLMDCTDCVNVITGGTSFTLLLHGFTATLASFDSVSYLWDNPTLSSSTSTATLAYVCQRMFSCVLSFTILNGCDRVKLAHYEILNVCNETRSHVRHFTLRDDLIKFYKYAKVLSPKFTAVGFFRLERKLCLSFLSVFMTYFIFVGQLYMSAHIDNYN